MLLYYILSSLKTTTTTTTATTTMSILLLLLLIISSSPYVTSLSTPMITFANPRQTSISGGITLTIQGFNLGTNVSDIASITIANVPCNSIAYTSSNHVECNVQTAGSSARTGSISLTTYSGGVSNTTEIFSYLCPVGTFQMSSGACITCASGTYNNIVGASNCTMCPPGAECTTTVVTPCTSGTYSSGGQSSCTTCSPGSYSLVSSATKCITCAPGQSCSGGSNVQSCPPGESNALSGQSSCTPCTTGTYASGTSSTTCTPCPKDHVCTATTATECTAGSYSLGGTDTCHSCGVGTYRPGTYVEGCLACPSGSISNTVGATSCNVCPQGYYCPNATHTIICPRGTYSHGGGATHCTPCDTGTYARNEGSSKCEFCPRGHSCNIAHTEPQLCALGYMSAGGHVSNCTQCPSGTISSSTRDACQECPVGSSCNDPTVGAIVCDPGTYSIGGVVQSCTQCPAGHSCTSNAAPIMCAPGTYSLLGNGTCQTCPRGYKCPNPAALPTACPSGSYSENGATQCIQCRPGMMCMSPSALPQPCLSGWYSLGGATNCTHCPTGKYCPSSSFPPLECPRGYYATAGATQCLVCPAGYSCSCDTSSYAPPSLCPPGSFSLQGSLQCLVCPPGFECTSTSIEPQACTPGTYSIGNQIQCTACPPGSACPSIDTAQVVACHTGTYSTGNASTCTPCPSGAYCESTTSSTHTLCTLGTYSLGAQQACTPCPAGWRCPSIHGELNEECPRGSYAIGNGTDCTTCPPGYACPSTTSIDTITTCTAGTYSLGNQTSCYSCPPGFECAQTTTAPVACTRGSFSVGGTITSCTPCQAGYSCPYTHDGTSIQCPQGTYSLAGEGECKTCPAGSSCAQTTVAPTPCTSGYFSRAGDTSCTECPGGYECTTTSTAPTICPVGTYSPIGSTTCNACDPGYLCPLGSPHGNSSLNICPNGYYCPSSTLQLPCPAGTMGIANTPLTSINECVACPAGTYCTQGTSGPASSTTLPCPMGHYCPENTTYATQYACESGRYNSKFGATSIAACIICESGVYCPQGSTHANQTCPSGYYCPQGTGDVCISGQVAPCESNAPKPCPNGTYTGVRTGLKSVDQCTMCPPGSYCLLASVQPIACPPGTYNEVGGGESSVSCVQCRSGTACASAGLTAPQMNCSTGHYCPRGTVYSTQYPCPLGTYTNEMNLENVNQCTVCPAGYACAVASGGTDNPPIQCAPGHYCPPGTHTSTQYACPRGTYSNRTNLHSIEQCLACPPGSYCDSSGSVTITGTCPRGYYCPLGTTNATQYACTGGTYGSTTGLTSQTQCTPCPLGHICAQASTTPSPCAATTYTARTHTGSTDTPTCTPCPAGYACTSGTSTPTMCTPGTYSSISSSVCATCLAGYYCDTNATTNAQMLTNECPRGMFCPAGLSQRPSLSANACPIGQYCPTATPTPQNCPAGTYNPYVGANASTECTACPAGHYCTVGSSSITGPCDTGHYCLINSMTSTANACPPQTYRSTTHGTSLQSCATCPSGSYCPVAGTSTPTTCPHGSFCVSGVQTHEGCPIGTFGNTTALRSNLDCSVCTPGYYCDTIGLTEPTGPCDAGYVCVGGARISAPTTSILGGYICTPGSYCPQASSKVTPCPAGSFGNVTGATTSTDCALCPPGQYCLGSSSTKPTGDCFGGYYCPAGSSSPTQVITPPGYYSLSGAYQAEPCASGTYNSESGRTQCLPCPQGYYCRNESTTIGSMCPQGYYCPQGSSEPLACPPGTYNDRNRVGNITSCTACPVGKYCESAAASAITGECDAGSFCVSGASSAAPTDGIHGYACPQGYYCPRGTTSPQPCPMGTYVGTTGSSIVTQCVPCPAGSYCSTNALSTPSGTCPGGYYCPENTTNAYAHECTRGHECPLGSANEVACPPGSFANTTGLSSCYECPPGMYCMANTIHPSPCVSGGYCPRGSNITLLCPPGTYATRTDLYTVSQCTSCTPGSYCLNSGSTTVTGTCIAGYVCALSSIYETGGTSLGASPYVHCPQGHYCPRGTSIPIACPIGTFMASTNAIGASNCTACTPGSYCNTTGLSAPSGPCTTGYYCTIGTTVHAPTNPTEHGGGACPSGTYCPTGSPQPIGCPPGTYNPQTTRSTCITCPQGYYCNANASDYTSNVCPRGSYCPLGTEYATEYPCPAGTFNNQTTMSFLQDCQSCPRGSYCAPSGRVNPTGLCSSGYYCTLNATTATPTDGITGNICSEGYYCPEGAHTQIPCPPGKYCSGVGNSMFSGSCAAGHYCVSGATTDTPTTVGEGGYTCPQGHYCPIESSSPQPCTMGTFNPSTGGVSELISCIPCTSGGFCNDTGLTSVPHVCTAGFYCTNGTASPTKQCPIGHKCPYGSSSPIACTNGEYQANQGQSTCTTCPAGSYCNGLALTTYQICPRGSYCPAGTQYATEYPCANGTFGNITALQQQSGCHACTPGYYCQSPLNIEPTGQCFAGFYCLIGAGSPTPTDGTSGNICPAGRYCPRGSSLPIACPTGTYASGEGQTNSSACLPCPAGQYCTTSGATSLTANATYCNDGYVCLSGSDTPTPTDNIRGYLCGIGQYCPSGTTNPLLCAPGTLNPHAGRGSCDPCPRGQYCNAYGMTNGTDCPHGFYCPEGTATPFSCPLGSLGLQTTLTAATECTPCGPGEYCSGYNLTAPSGTCDAGYLCTSNASSPNPSSMLCPAGHYCGVGALSATACNIGTMNPSTGGNNINDCVPCTPGSYCATSGLSAPTGPCTAGYYCPSGSSVSNNIPCPIGHYCPLGAATPQGCADGTYQSRMNQTTCDTCPSGYICQQNATQPQPCPLRSYCPQGISSPILCPNGTYGHATLLTASNECAQCPSGRYCVAGDITGVCTAGYICYSSNDTPTPSTYIDGIGGPCPAGYYCESGVVTPTACPNGTVRASTGGTDINSCGPCPAGNDCLSGNPVPVACPAGHYCPFSMGAIACPIGTYGPLMNQVNISACLQCPAGYYCGTSGLNDYAHSPCPVSYYCQAGVTSPTVCPSGTYRATTGAQLITDCTNCAAGSYCPSGVSTTNICPPGTYCPSTIGDPTPCPPASYCPAGASIQLPCPSEAYCPGNTSSPTPCPNGYYCPSSSSYPILCPLGYRFNFSTTDRSSVNTACTQCPDGTYGAHENRSTCLTCEPGYVCHEGTTAQYPTNVVVQHGFECPQGYYCPSGSSKPIPCPPGMYNRYRGNSSIDACQPCKPGSFASIGGSPGCLPCGSSAWSIEQADTCYCNGTYRSYQPYDGSCLCHPGYEFYDEGRNLYVGDSSGDCIPIIYERCKDNEVRNALGHCIENSPSYCDIACNTLGGGTVNSDVGLCICNQENNVEQLCNSTCQRSQPVLVLQETLLTVMNPSVGHVSLISLPIDGLLGELKCSSTSFCTLHTVLCDATGHTAILGLPPAITDEVSSAQVLNSYVPDDAGYYTTTSASYDFHSLGTSDAVYTSSVKQYGYANPTICLSVGEGLVWDLSVNPYHYPIYVKHSNLNSNPNFDFGPFRMLAQKIQQNATAVEMFVFVFNDAGTYTFADNLIEDKMTIVQVLPLDRTCPVSTLGSTSLSRLVGLGVLRNSDLYLEPDLVIVALILASFFAVTLFVTTYTKMKQRRSKNEMRNDGSNNNKGKVDDFVKLFRKLDDDRLHQDQLFAKQRKDFRSQCDRITGETEQLKALVAIKTGSARSFAEASLNLLIQEITSRHSYKHRQCSRESQIWERLDQFKSTLLPQTYEDTMELQTQLSDFQSIIDDMIVSHEKESQRRSVFASQNTIVGDDVVLSLCRYDVDENTIEKAFHEPLLSFCDPLRAINDQCIEAEHSYQTTKREMEVAQNSAVNQLEERYILTVQEYCNELRMHLNHLQEMLTAKQTALDDVRENAEVQCEEAKELAKKRLKSVVIENQEGLFRGITPQLAQLIMSYINDNDLVVMHRKDWEDTEQPGLANDDDDDDDDDIDIIDEMHQVKASYASKLEEECMETLQELASNPLVTEEQLQLINNEMQKKKHILNKILDTQHQQHQTQQLRQLNEDILDDDDKIALAEAHRRLEIVQHEHELEEQKIHDEMQQEQQKLLAEEMRERELADKRAKEEREQLNQKLEEELEVMEKDRDRAGIMKEHELKIRKVDDELKKNRTRGKERLKQMQAVIRQRLAHQKQNANKKKKEKLRQQRKEIERIRKQAVDKNKEKHDVIPGLHEIERMVTTNTKTKTQEQSALEREHMRLRRELEEEQRRQNTSMKESLDKEEKRRLATLEAELDRRQREKMTAKRQDMEATIAARQATSELSSSELDDVMKEHMQEMKALENSFAIERERQQKKLRENMIKRRRKKEKALRKRQELAMQKEIKQQQSEMLHSSLKATRDKEMDVLKEILSVTNRRQAKNIIERVFNPRFRKEKAALLSEQWQTTANALSHRVDEAFEELNVQKDALRERLKLNEITQDEFDMKMNELDDSIDPSALQQETLVKLEAKNQKARQLQFEAQFNEVKSTFLKFYPDEQFTSPEWHIQKLDLDAIVAIHAQSRAKEEQHLQDTLLQLKREEREFVAKKKQIIAEKQRQHEELMEQQRVEAEKELERRLQDTEEKERLRKEELLIEHQRKLEEQLVGASGDERETILEQHRQDVERERTRQDAEIERQQQKLRERLKAEQEKKRKRAMKRKAAEEKAKFEAEELQRRKQIEELEEQQRLRAAQRENIFKQAVVRFMKCGQHRATLRLNVRKAIDKMKRSVLEKRQQKATLTTSVSGILAAAGGGERNVFIQQPLQPLQQQSIMNGEALCDNKSPFLMKLQQIEGMLNVIADNEGIQASTHDKHTRFNDVPIFRDNKEDKISHECDGDEPVVIDVTTLSAKVYSVYQFGCYILELLNEGNDETMNNMTLKLVASLPRKPNDFPLDNAFRSSVLYDKTNHIIYVHNTRAVDVGELSLVLVHTIAHIHCRKWSDLNQAFIKCFFMCLRRVYSELYMKQQGNTLNHMSGFITLTQARSSEMSKISDTQLKQRLDRLSAFHNDSKLRKQMKKIEVDCDVEQQVYLEEKHIQTRDSTVLTEEIEELESVTDKLHGEISAIVKKLQQLSAKVLELHSVKGKEKELIDSRNRIKVLNQRKNILTQQLAGNEERIRQCKENVITQL